jgi:Family of unknown function (DUF6370)
MKQFFSLIFVLALAFNTMAQTTAVATGTRDPKKPLQEAEVSCGKCKLGLQGKTCEMAVRIDNKSYYVDGADIDSFGDAHAHDGLCNAIRPAEVQGEMVNGRFKISYIKLIPQVKKEEKQ